MMGKLFCDNCGHQFEDGGKHILSKNGTDVCESCFFNYALKVLGARELKISYEDWRTLDDGWC